MKALAAFVMRSSTQAAMVAALSCMASVLFPLLSPISVFGSAAVALVTLRNGAQPGLLVVGLATVACGLFGQLLLGNAWLLVASSLLIWGPVWLLALVLRGSRSLAMTVQAGLAIGLLVIGIAYLQLSGQPEAELLELLRPLGDTLQESDLADAEQAGLLVSLMASWLIGALAAGLFLQALFGLMLGRWWQSLLYNPGGFRSEFHGLRLHPGLVWVALPVLGLTLTGAATDWEWVRYLGVLLLALYFLQGLAVAHGVAGLAGAHPGWLVALYLLVFLAMAHAVMALAAVGLTDAWFDYRARIKTSGRNQD